MLGRDDEALAAYAEAQRLSLPFPELHYNRADLLAARGEEDAAIADLDRVLELDPGFLSMPTSTGPEFSPHAMIARRRGRM